MRPVSRRPRPTAHPQKLRIRPADYCHPVPERWTRAVLRFRVPGARSAWLAVLAVGVVAADALPQPLSNVFTVPGTESDTARQILQRHFGERPDGVFTVVFRAPRTGCAAAAATSSTPRHGSCPARMRRSCSATAGILFGEIDSTLDLQHAKGYTDDAPPRAPRRAYVTGAAGDPARPRARALARPAPRRGDRAADRARRPPRRVRPLARRARPVRLRRLHDHRRRSAAVYAARARASRWSATSRTSSSSSGSASPSTTRCSSSTASARSSPRRGRRRRDRADDGDRRPLGALLRRDRRDRARRSCSSCRCRSSARSASAASSSRSLSLAAAATLQPALLSLLGARGMRADRARCPAARDLDRGFWARLARAIMRRPLLFLAVGVRGPRRRGRPGSSGCT